MTSTDAAIGVFADHILADGALRKLVKAGFATQRISLIGRGYHTEEQVIGFYNTGEQIRFWGARGTFWGAQWDLFHGGVFMVVPGIGHVFVVGDLAAAAVSAVEGAVVVGGLSALGAALASLGVPRNSVIAYEAALKADAFLVVVHGIAAEASYGSNILTAGRAMQVDIHSAPARDLAAFQEARRQRWESIAMRAMAGPAA